MGWLANAFGTGAGTGAATSATTTAAASNVLPTVIGALGGRDVMDFMKGFSRNPGASGLPDAQYDVPTNPNFFQRFTRGMGEMAFGNEPWATPGPKKTKQEADTENIIRILNGIQRFQ